MKISKFSKYAVLLPFAAQCRFVILASCLLSASATYARGVSISNKAFQLSVNAESDSILCEVLHVPSKTRLAAGPYSYPFPFAGTPQVEQLHGSIRISGNLEGGLKIVHHLRLSPEHSYLEEQISIENQNSYPVAMPHGRAGFVLPVEMKGNLAHNQLADFRFAAVPYLREPGAGNGQYAIFSLEDVLTKPRISSLRSGFKLIDSVMTTYSWTVGFIETVFPEYASEGWCLYNGKMGFVISKYSQDGMEWSLLDRVPSTANTIGLRWGGFGIYNGDPEHAAWLQPGTAYNFGVTRVTPFLGGLNEGFYSFRSEMEGRGMGLPKGYNPPIHWNELYDNKLWWLGIRKQDDPVARAELYSLDDMKEEAAKAQAIGCEALYLDPGWDTNFGSKIWDEKRLGPLSEFTSMLRRDYDLSLSLHAPMSGWGNPESYSKETLRINSYGDRVAGSLCGSSTQYRDETVRRLLALAKGGARFVMLDGTMYHDGCWSTYHGHKVPALRQEHAAALNEIAYRVKADYPEVQIEMHDQILGGSRLRYVPTYFGYGNGGFDSVWAFELMWSPLKDLLGGHSIALYYYNLAYSIPLYLHIDLRNDTAEGLMFWWNASTVRHLGIGGTSEDSAIVKMHQEAMVAYKRLKEFFVAGRFYGVDELTHVHVHPTRSAVVINCFNLTEQPENRRIKLSLASLGLKPGKVYNVVGATVEQQGDNLILDAQIRPLAHLLIEID